MGIAGRVTEDLQLSWSANVQADAHRRVAEGSRQHFAQQVIKKSFIYWPVRPFHVLTSDCDPHD